MFICYTNICSSILRVALRQKTNHKNTEPKTESTPYNCILCVEIVFTISASNTLCAFHYTCLCHFRLWRIIDPERPSPKSTICGDCVFSNMYNQMEHKLYNGFLENKYLKYIRMQNNHSNGMFSFFIFRKWNDWLMFDTNIDEMRQLSVNRYRSIGCWFFFRLAIYSSIIPALDGK